MKIWTDVARAAGFRGQPDTSTNTVANGWGVRFASLLLLFPVACDRATTSTAERSAAPASPSSGATTVASVTAPSSAAPTPAATSDAAASDPCAALRKTVVAEAAKLAACKTDADCKVHPVPLCDFVELGCYGAHVNKASNTADFDGAVSAYAKSCPPSKCKCAMPSKSACTNGTCSAK